MQIPSESFEAVGYCLLSVKSIDNKSCICEIDVSGMSDTTSDTISDSSSNVISMSRASSAMDFDLSVSGIDFNIDISDIEILFIDTIYIEDKLLPNIIVEKHEQKNIVDHLDFHNFCCILSAVIESFIFEEASYLFAIFG
jgi:hypothetical protein